jgi:hypothetical protein
MSEAEQVTVITGHHPTILNELQGGERTWDQLQTLTKINDDNLGFMIGELLNRRKIWTAHKNDVRVYGLERRIGLLPRFTDPQRRATDQ